MKRIAICIVLIVMMITSCSVDKRSGHDGLDTVISTETKNGSPVPSGSEEVTESENAEETEQDKALSIPDGIKVVVCAGDDFSSEILNLPDDTLPPLKSDFINSDAEPVKYLDYNGTTICLHYERSIKSRYCEFAEDVYYRDDVQDKEKRVMFFENGEVRAISDDFLGNVNVDDLYDTEKMKSELIGRFSGIAPYFDKYDSFTVKKIGSQTEFMWYDDIVGAVSYDRITIGVSNKGEIKRFVRDVMPEEILKYKPDITREQIELIIKQEKDLLLEKAGMKTVKVNKEEFTYTSTYVSYEGKPAFECYVVFYGHKPGDIMQFEGINAIFVIVVDRYGIE